MMAAIDIHGVDDGYKNGLSLGFEHGSVGSYHDGCDKDWRDGIKAYNWTV